MVSSALSSGVYSLSSSYGDTDPANLDAHGCGVTTVANRNPAPRDPPMIAGLILIRSNTLVKRRNGAAQSTALPPGYCGWPSVNCPLILVVRLLWHTERKFRKT